MAIATTQQQHTARHRFEDGWFKSKAIVSTLTVPSLRPSLYFRLSMDSSQDAAAAVQAVSVQ